MEPPCPTVRNCVFVFITYLALGLSAIAGANALIPITTATITIAANDIVLFIVPAKKISLKRILKCHNNFLL